MATWRMTEKKFEMIKRLVAAAGAAVRINSRDRRTAALLVEQGFARATPNGHVATEQARKYMLHEPEAHARS